MKGGDFLEKLKQQNAAGCVPSPAAMAKLTGMTRQGAHQHMRRLVEKGLLVFDEDTGVYYIVAKEKKDDRKTV